MLRILLSYSTGPHWTANAARPKILRMKNQRKLTITILQHSDGTPPGTVTDWLRQKGYGVDVRLLHKGDALPSIEQTDWVIILGGAMNVDDTVEFPWLKDEKRFLKEAVDAGKSCLGLCLGGQLLAQTLGGTVRKNEHWEAGWFRVALTGDGKSKDDLTVFQFHQDAFTLPPGAERFATNAITANQAFKYGEHVVGIQFHPETTLEWVKSFADEDPYPTGPYVQSLKELLAGAAVHLDPMRAWFFSLLNEMEKAALQRPTKD